MPENRRELRNLLESSPDPIFLTTVDGRVVEANQACLDLFRADPAELGDLRAPELYADPADRQRFRATMEAEGSVTGWEVEMRRLDGTRFTASVSAAVRLDGGDDVVGFMGFIRDVTAEKESAQALKDAEQRYRSFVDLNPQGIYAIDVEGRITDVNGALSALVGAPRDELVGEPFGPFLAPEDRERGEEQFRAALAGEPQTYALGILTRSGEVREVEGVSIPLRVGGSVVGVHGILRDVTEERRAREALREREESYRTLFDSVTEAIYIQDEEGRFLDVNRAAEEMYGYTRDEMIGATPALVACPDRVDLEATLEHVRRAREGETPYFEWWGRRKDGECFPKEVSLTAGRYLGRDVVIAVARDVSESMRLEERLRQAQKMEAVGRLAGGVAHDFNNVLTAIQGHCELALEEAPADGALRGDLQEIRANAGRAARLTRQLLAFSRRQVMRTEVLDLGAVLADVQVMLRRLIGEDIRIAIHVEDGLWPVEADRSQMEQVIVNLALNARDAMPSGGRLELRLENHVEPPADGSGDPAPKEAGRWVRLSVRDDGAGMDQQTLRHVFEPFFTTKEQGKGTGLGLATVYGIVKQSGGVIEVESEPGRGTCFEIALRAVEGDAARGSGSAAADHADAAGTADVPAETRATILLCEDEGAVREVGRRALERHGFRVIEAVTPAEALRVAREHADPIDLLLTDVLMPGMSGWELADRVRERLPDLPVLVVSGYAPGTAGAPMTDALVLEKPFSPTALVEKVREALE